MSEKRRGFEKIESCPFLRIVVQDNRLQYLQPIIIYESVARVEGGFCNTQMETIWLALQVVPDSSPGCKLKESNLTRIFITFA